MSIRPSRSYPPAISTRWLLAAVAMFAWSHAAAQTADPLADSAGAVPSREQVEQRMEAIDKSTDLAEGERDKLRAQLETVLTDLTETARFEAAAADYKASIEAAPRQAEEIRAKLADAAAADDGTTPAPDKDLPADADLPTVEGLIAAEQAEVLSLDARLTDLSEALEAADQQPARIRERTAAIDDALRDLPAADVAPTGQPNQTEQVRNWALAASRARLRAERQMLEQQVLSAAARRQLTLAQRDEAQADLVHAKARRKAFDERADELRREESAAVQETINAERVAAAEADPVVQRAVEQNAELGAAIAKATAALDRLDQQRSTIEQRTTRIQEDFANARQRLEAGGLNRAQGQVLIDQRAALPDMRRLNREASERADQMGESTLLSIRWREELRQLDDLDAWVEKLLAQPPENALPPDERAKLAEQLRAQAKTRITLLRTALDMEDSYRRALGEVDFAAQRLRDVVQRSDRYLSERLLWVRSIVPPTEQDFGPLPQAIWWIVAPTNWARLGRTLAVEAPQSPLFWIGLTAVAVLLWRSAPLKRAIRASAEPLRRISTDRFRHTLTALSLTLLTSLAWPLLMLTIGMVLSRAPTADAFSKSMGEAMIAVVPALFFLLAFRMLCMRGGVADRHFRWQSDTLVLLRRTAYSAVTLLLPIGFVAAAVHNHQNPEFTGTLGRLSLALFEFGLAALTAVVLHPTRGALKHILAERPDGWLSRLRMLWYPAMIALPLGLGGLALAGFLYTSGILLERLVNELWFALGLIVTHQLIVRWLIVTRRKLALQAAIERRAQREAAKAMDASGAEALAVQSGPVDLASLDAQTRRLLNLSVFVAAAVGLWLIWSDVLPALNVFERVTLWSYTATVDGVEQAAPVTLADLGLVVLIIATAIAAARHLPALLEILLLQNSSITAGSRYTIITLTGYTISAIGAIMVFSTLGLSWGQVQWLVAALGVGIGFGLQEIVANFVSGLIILFERPVRVGDIVSIGDTTGVVTKIEIRATTVRNWDRQELLVPNKEFITGRLLNWTLTDQINRIVVPIGIEYGSDTRKALQLLADVARENEHVLDDPAPLISFEGFGDDALSLVLRCYLQSMEHRLDTITALHQAIDDKFRGAGIGIAFPQRDIHLRSSEPLEVRLRRTSDRPPAPLSQPESTPPSRPADASS